MASDVPGRHKFIQTPARGLGVAIPQLMDTGAPFEFVVLGKPFEMMALGKPFVFLYNQTAKKKAMAQMHRRFAKQRNVYATKARAKRWI